MRDRNGSNANGGVGSRSWADWNLPSYTIYQKVASIRPTIDGVLHLSKAPAIRRKEEDRGEPSAVAHRRRCASTTTTSPVLGRAPPALIG